MAENEELENWEDCHIRGNKPEFWF